MTEETPPPAIPQPPATSPTPSGQTLAPRKEWFNIDTPMKMFGALAGLTEFVLIVAIICVKDVPLTWAMFIFAVCIFSGVAWAFFWFLKERTEALMDPRHFQDTNQMVAYIREIRARSQEALYHELSPASQATVQAEASTVISTVIDVAPISVEGGRPKQLEAGDTLTLFFGPSSLEGSYTRPYPGDLSKITNQEERIAYVPTEWIGTFIMEASSWFARAGFPNAPEGYGLTWAMRVQGTNTVLTDIGFTRTLEDSGIKTTDYRSLHQTSVKPGMILEPINLPPPSQDQESSPQRSPSSGPSYRTRGYDWKEELARLSDPQQLIAEQTDIKKILAEATDFQKLIDEAQNRSFRDAQNRSFLEAQKRASQGQ